MHSRFILALAAAASTANAWMPANKPANRSLDAFMTLKSEGPGQVRRWLYGSGKLRGVNLGSQFISEPWMLSDEWTNTMGCGDARSEFDCMLALGQENGNAVFQAHWQRWITTDDIQNMRNLGLNTIRIPLGYWLLESLVDSSEHFPQGALPYLDALVGKASDLGMYIIIDFHGAPYTQKNEDAFTGQWSSSAGFYQTSQYERAYTWLKWMTDRIHTNSAYRNVGMLELLNEPLREGDQIDSEKATMTQEYYPNALQAIRDTESGLGVSSNNKLHVQMMDSLWGAGNPKSNLPNDPSVAFDDHEYIKGASPGSSMQDYINYACQDDRTRDGDSPKVVGEWSLSISGDYEGQSQFDPQSHIDDYARFFTAQIQSYERTEGWVFWNWKVNWSQYGDFRWDYQAAAQAGVIPNSGSGLDNAIASSVC